MTQTTAKKTAPRKTPARTADPLAAVLAEVQAAAKTVGPMPAHLVGGVHPDRGIDAYRRRGEEWAIINADRGEVGVLGVDGLAIEVAFAAFGGRTPEEIRGGLVRLGSLAVAAVAQIDREGT
ncbi:hypothetical protein [Streptomyces antarcticus]|uniref:hypothetical protein n=1 Tax=Streptomyces antarcticus TaxID=2996458 RepID=UPI00226D963F|nr:hypothetical protein [Streptomyces sp. H34-AA3]MCY0947176.1 hypothetical protein [Streptomyces sp. H34-AA3]